MILGNGLPQTTPSEMKHAYIYIHSFYRHCNLHDDLLYPEDLQTSNHIISDLKANLDVLPDGEIIHDISTWLLLMKLTHKRLGSGPPPLAIAHH